MILYFGRNTLAFRPKEYDEVRLKIDKGALRLDKVALKISEVALSFYKMALCLREMATKTSEFGLIFTQPRVGN